MCWRTCSPAYTVVSTVSRALYRSRQFLGALRPRLSHAERNEVSATLGPRLLPLFDSMTLRDQRHCLDVHAAVKENGCRDPHVLMAALLHDAGKGQLAGASIRLHHRVSYVMLAAGAPWLLRRLAASGRGGLGSLHHHPERGAILAEALGAPEPVVELIRRHEDRNGSDERLRLLRLADDSR